MSPSTLRIIIVLVLLVHGIGQIMGILPILGVSSMESWNVDSWLLTDLIGDTAARVVAFILFLAAALGFVGASLALLGWLVPHDWWRTLAWISAVISLVALGLFWNAFVMFFPNKIGSIAVNVAVLAGLLWANWPAEVDIAAR